MVARIGILTGSGDCPEPYATIRAIVRRTHAVDLYRVVEVVRG